MTTMDLIDTLYRFGRLNAIDVRFSRFIGDLEGSRQPALMLAAALLCHTTAEGNTCLDLERYAGRILIDRAADRSAIACPPIGEWTRRLHAAGVIGGPGQHKPLILDGRNRLYLCRFWQFEREVSVALARRAAKTEPIVSFNANLLRDSLNRLFPQSSAPGPNNRQMLCALMALLKKLCVISGGPGTGKTTVVAKILALLLEQAGQGGLKIRLAAPTGKAAARLTETLKSAKASLDCSAAIRGLMPGEAQTVHRLLQPIAGTSNFHHQAQNPLDADIVVIDEASMVDLALMANLTRALPEQARLILIGDRDQLASVEAGAVFGDICGGYVEERLSTPMLHRICELTRQNLAAAADGPAGQVLQDCIVTLSKSYRFAAESGIGALSRAVNQGDVETALALLGESTDGSVKWQPVAVPQDLLIQVKERFAVNGRFLLACDDPVRAFDRFNRERWLCVLREGPWGVKRVNEWVERVAHQEALIRRQSGADPRWYAGRPILITANDYQLGLFNGDSGLALPGPDGSLSVFFQGPQGDLRKFSPHRIGDHATAWAMTVHKSQGSEFDHVHLILPDRDVPLLSRELIYTAITRAKSSVTIYGPRRILATAIKRKVRRSSGLKEALWGRESHIGSQA